jgi:hypothetical protein
LHGWTTFEDFLGVNKLLWLMIMAQIILSPLDPEADALADTASHQLFRELQADQSHLLKI